ncbi:hypothetical protein, partial [Mycolicibacterium conceptionense]
KTPKTGIKKTNHPTWQEDGESPTKMAKKQQTKTTKHTIEFSNNRLFCFVTLFWGNLTSVIGTLPASQVASSWLISSGLRQPRQLSTFSAGLSSRSGPGGFPRSAATSKD